MNNSGLNSNWRLALYAVVCTILASGSAFGGRVSDVRGTKHNLSAAADGAAYPGGTVPTRTVKATSETEVCVFCHTPHGSSLAVPALWNRTLSTATYTPYTSSSLDANILQPGDPRDPAGSSKLCLSCHDGTLAIGSVNVLNGIGDGQSVAMTGVAGGGVMADGSGTTTGYTRNLGVNLTNDHPISVTYTSALSDRDGELRWVDSNQKYPALGSIIGPRSAGLKPKAPLEPTGTAGAGQIQCSACHDPHLRETAEATVGNQKFLRLNRFQEVAPTATYSDTDDINCVTCHDKNNGTTGTWAYSAHANANLTLGANQTYKPTAATQREFPSGLPVWKASCLNCHDTHTVQGSRRLLREGTDSTATPKAGGNSAVEETCFQCHTTAGASIVENGNPVSDIKSDFALSRHMPITLADQGNPASEAHDIGSDLASGAGTPAESSTLDCSSTTNKCGADFVEKRSKLGAGNNLANRHAECTDCHNPHRTVKFRTFAQSPLSSTPHSAGIHGDAADVLTHDQAGYTHTNIASGVLRGTFGVEPVYPGASFASLPTSFNVKRGDPGTSTSTLATEAYVTREYQICLKCHSNYGYDDDNLSDATTMTRPQLGSAGLTAYGTNNLTHYTNQAKEFQAPLAHQGEGTTTDSGAAAAFSTNNHRSWHPVMDATGRTLAITGVGATAFNLPWSNAVGTQTMYCADCHGSNVTSTTSVVPDSGKPWGPHGSNNDFILKGTWSSATGSSAAGKAGTTDLCFKCHDYNSYALGVAAAAAAGGVATGFKVNAFGGVDGHQLHVDSVGARTDGGPATRCNWCHVAVPHGWKNKALLVNLNDVGPEAGLAAGTQIVISDPLGNVTTAYNNAPYYLNARNAVVNFAPSGAWTANDCGSSGPPGNNKKGKSWMSLTAGPDNTENCQTPP